MTNAHDPQTSSAQADATDRSLAYWLRATAALTARETDAALAAAGTTRRERRVLNALSGDSERAERLRERLERGGKRLFTLVERGLIVRAEDGWQLTAAGETVRDRANAAVREVQARVTESVPEADFETTLATLEAISRELGWTEETRLPRGGRGHGHGRGFGRGHGHGHGHGFGRGHDVGRGHGHHPHHPDHQGAGFEHAGFGRGGCDHTGSGHTGHQGHQGHGGRGGRGHGGHGRGFERGFTAGFAAAQRTDEAR